MIRVVLTAALALWAGLAKAEIEVQAVTSPGGIEAWLVEEHSIPFVSLEIRIVGGASLDRPGKRGAINLMTGLLEEGSGDLDAREFQAAREGLAASFGYDVYDDSFALSFQALTENRDEALALFRASIIDPTFDDVAVERVRAQVIAGIESEAQRPNSIAGDRFFADAFGDHPYGSDMSGTIESVQALTRDDLVQAHRDVLVRDRIYVGAVGDITPEELGVLLDDLLGGLPVVDADEAAATDLAFATAEVARLTERLEHMRAEQADFLEQANGALPKDMDQNQSRFITAQQRLAELTARRSTLEALAEASSEMAATQRGPLETLKAELAQAELVYSQAHPRVIQLRAQIEALEASGAEAPVQAGVVDAVQLQLDELDARIAAANDEITEVRGRIESTPANGVLVAAIEREIDLIEQQLTSAVLDEGDARVANRGPLDIDFGLPGGVTVVDYPTPQSVALFGQPGMKRDDEDFFAAYILNHILGGGGFESRLMQEVREERGLTYGIGTYLVPKDHAEMVLGSVASSNATMAEAIEVIRDEWRRIAAEGVTPEELEAAKTYLTGEYPLRFDGNGPIADIMVGMQVQGLPRDYIVNRNDFVNAVTLEDVNRVAAELLDADALHFVVVGQPEGLGDSE